MEPNTITLENYDGQYEIALVTDGIPSLGTSKVMLAVEGKDGNLYIDYTSPALSDPVKAREIITRALAEYDYEWGEVNHVGLGTFINQHLEKANLLYSEQC